MGSKIIKTASVGMDSDSLPGLEAGKHSFLPNVTIDNAFKFKLPKRPDDEDILLYNEYLYRNRFEYVLEYSVDGFNWKFVASFEEGVMSRFNMPFDDKIALMEAKAYKKHKGVKYVRIIIEV